MSMANAEEEIKELMKFMNISREEAILILDRRSGKKRNLPSGRFIKTKWFSILKVGGAVATSNGGFNPSLYSESVEEDEEEGHPILEEKDFWRD